MEVELRLKVKGVTIELSPDEAKELVINLAKLTGQKVDAVTFMPTYPWPILPDRPERRRRWSDPIWRFATNEIVTGNTSWTTVYSMGDTSVQMRAVP